MLNEVANSFMLVGKTYGVAKKADLITVKFPTKTSGGGASFAVSAMLDGFTKILNDVRATKRGNLNPRGFVVNLSWGGSQDTNTGDWMQMNKLFDKLIAEDVVIVTASGNCRVRNPPDCVR
jgi:hypothetical protein